MFAKTAPPYIELDKIKISRYPPVIRAVFESNANEITKATGGSTAGLSESIQATKDVQKKAAIAVNELLETHRQFLTKIFYALARSSD